MKFDELDDAALINKIVKGETMLFAQLIRRHQRAIYGLGTSFLKNADDVAEFVQDVFLKAFRSLQFFEGRSRFSTWLYRIAYNMAVNTIKRRKEYYSLAEHDETPCFDTPERRALRAAAQAAVQKAVGELPDRYRICVDLFFFYDLSYEEIEVVTGFPVNTIKSHVFRAKKKLREHLADYADSLGEEQRGGSR